MPRKLTAAARRNGMRTLREDGWMKVRAGHDDGGRSHARDPGVLRWPRAFTSERSRSDGKLRTGTLTGETDKAVARELRNQGLTPVYVGARQPKKSLSTQAAVLRRAASARDVLFFTQELSTLLNSGVPLDRALSITSELTERAGFRFIVLDVLRVLKGGKSLADSLATHPEYFLRPLREHGARR